MQTQAYLRWCRQLSTLPLLQKVLHAIPCLSLSQRKALLTACRVQSFPHIGSRLYQRHLVDWESIVELDESCVPQGNREFNRRVYAESLWSLIMDLKNPLESPIISGFLSSVLRSAPIMDHTEYMKAKDIAIAKEIMASITEYNPIALDFRCILSSSQSHRSLPFAPNLPSCPHVASEIYEAFSRVKKSLENRILFPKIGNKTVGAEVQRQFEEVALPAFRSEVQEIIDHCGGVTTAVLQRLEFWCGQEVMGPVEVRSAWKYNDLKPRVYFAQGGNTFKSSKYVQTVFNELADSLEITHTKNRYSPPLHELTKKESVFIYDYTSFTSTLQQIIAFVRELSLFFKGTTVVLVGEKDGPTTHDLGELLESYNDTCNIFSPFDIGKLCQFFDDAPFLLGHTCGMLGVPGNIQSCTVLHGIHTAFIAESMFRSKCIGDDAKIIREMETFLDRLIMESQLRNIGQISLEKTEEFEFDDEDDYDLRAWHYAKRPILRSYNRIIQLHMTTFPTLDCILGLSDPNRTTKPNEHLLSNRRFKFSGVWNRLLKTLFVEQVNLNEDERLFLFSYQNKAFRSLEMIGRKPGRFEDKSGSSMAPVWCAQMDFGIDPIELVAAFYGYEEEVEVPAPSLEVISPMGYLGEVFESGSSKILEFLVKMGCLEKRIVYEKMTRKMVGEREFGRRVMSQHEFRYEFTVVRLIPTSMYSLM